MSAVFLDLDGVILDVSKRYYALHCDIVGQIGGDELDFERYWELKREQASVESITGLSREQGKEYRQRWNQLIEAPAYLEHDRYLPQARTALALLGSRYDVVIVTLRRKGAALRKQLKDIELPKVAQVLSAAPRGDSALTKAGLIQGSPHFDRSAVIVGDTEVDIRAGKELGLTTVGVLSGLRSASQLARESPDLLLEGIGELPAELRKLYAGGRP